MLIIKYLIFIGLLSLNLGNTYAKCQIDKACAEFEDASYACRVGKKDSECSKFVVLFKGLLKKGNCQRTFDTKPVFDVWYCSGIKGAASLDLHYSTLSNLKTKEAQRLYSSRGLRDTMDGAIGEEHRAKSIKLEKSLMKKSKK